MTQIKTQSTDRMVPPALRNSKGQLSKTQRVEPKDTPKQSTELSSLRLKKEMMKISEEFSEAERRGDLGFLEKNISDNFVGISPSGLLLGKQEWLKRYRLFNVNYLKFEVRDRRVRIFGSMVAILTGKQSSSVKLQDHLDEGEFRVTETYVNKEGHWMLANRQLSRIQQ